MYPANSKNRKSSLWEAAIGRLPKKDRSAFDFTDPDLLKTLAAVLQATEDVKDLCYKKMWKFTWNGEQVVLRDIADKTLAWVNKFKGMVDMIVQSSPTHLAVPWAPIKYLLQVCC